MGDSKHRPDLVTLARLHAALDSVVEAQALISLIQGSSAVSPRATSRVSVLFQEAREVLRGLLTHTAERQGVGSLSNPLTT